jgi:hypothetical protein
MLQMAMEVSNGGTNLRTCIQTTSAFELSIINLAGIIQAIKTSEVTVSSPSYFQ